MATGAINNEARHHRESAASIRLKAQKLRRALDGDKLEEAVRVAADVAAELRAPGTTTLTPKAYYDVYLSVCAELRVLEMYMLESARRGAPVLHLYERVQETPLVLPRLYLLVTTGAVYVRSEQAPAKDVLRDLVEMCAAVQHPQRGLFLRAYLAQMMKDKLPDVPSADWQEQQEMEENGGGSLVDSVEFVLRNFTEMNRLWVRMKNNVAVHERANVKNQRMELRLLVGSNLSTLSRLLSNDQHMYINKVLPAIVEQIVDCRDSIAQEYLADCVAQAFPDEFQLATLDIFLRMCAKLVRGVNLRTVLTSIIDRLTNYALTSESAKNEIRGVDAFDTFHRHFPAVLGRQQTCMALPERLHVFQSLMRLVLTLEPEKTESVDAVLALAVESAYLFVGPGENELVEEVNGTFYTAAPLGGVGSQNAGVTVNPRPTAQPLRSQLTDEEEKLALEILSMPLSEYRDVAVALRLNNFGELQQLLCFEKQYTLAARVLRSVREYKPCIAEVSQLEKLFVYVRPLVVGERATVNEPISPEDMSSPAAIFNPDTLSPHHAYLSAEVSLGTWNAASAGNQHANTEPDPASEPASLNYEEEGIDPIEEQQQFMESQELVARIVFLCHNDSIAGTVALFEVIRSHLLVGDAKRRAITLPPLTFAVLQLAMRANETSAAAGESMNDASAPTQIVHFAVACVEALVPEHPMIACRLYLQTAVAAAAMAMAVGSDVVYDAVAKAFLIFENMINAAAEQFTSLEAIAGTLAQIRGALPSEAYLALARRAEKHAANLLARSDQCLALLACTAMYGKLEEEEIRAVSCIDAATNAARACSSTAERFFLWVAVANRMMKLVEDGCTAVGGKDRLRDVLWAMRDIVANRATKTVPLGRAALRRRALILAHIRAQPNVFSFLNVAEL